MPRYHLTIKNHKDGIPPCQAFTVGKLDFRLRTQVRSKMEGVDDEVYNGAVGEYSEADVAAFRESVKHFVVRWTFGENKAGKLVVRAGQIHDTRCRDAIRVPEREESLEGYLVVRPLGSEALVPLPESVITAEQAAARQEAEASEARARATDPTDERRRKVNARAKAAGEPVEA